MERQAGFWDYEGHLARLAKSGDPLAAVADFEPFRYRLKKALNRPNGSKGGRPPYDPVLMFKVLVLQALVLHHSFSSAAPLLVSTRFGF